MKDKKENAPQGASTEELTDEQLLEMSGGFEKKFAKEIQERIDAGLTREQAVDVQKAQVAEDLAAAKEAAKAKK